VFDAAAELGGLSVAARFPEFTWDRYYHVIAGGDRALIALLQELGLGDRLRWTRASQGGFAAGSVRSLVGPLDLLRLPGLSLLDKLRLGWFALRGHRPLPDAVLDGTTAADWVAQRCGARAFARFWRPLLRSKLGDAADAAAARFLHATLGRLQSARGRRTREQFGYVRGGYRTVLEALTAQLRERGAELRPNSPVRSVRTAGDDVD